MKLMEVFSKNMPQAGAGGIKRPGFGGEEPPNWPP